MNNSDQFFIKCALKEAKKAAALGEVPVGAVLVINQKIIAQAHNQVESAQDSSAHAELLVIQKANQILNRWRLTDATLYCTLEPCMMCAGAMILARVKRLVYAAPDLRHGVDGSFISVFEKKHPIHQIEITRGVCAEEAGQLMKDFFKKVRGEKRCQPTCSMN